TPMGQRELKIPQESDLCFPRKLKPCPWKAQYSAGANASTHLKSEWEEATPRQIFTTSQLLSNAYLIEIVQGRTMYIIFLILQIVLVARLDVIR
ncbi:hypothetical protein, partial [Gracilibacillus thailandensis]|uniref:hypothetical protein n=1 Tax=Gracilibacillus thailandensis TaxID=563735 RepID=UPI001E593CA3